MEINKDKAPVAVVAAVITREGRVLACQRNRTGKFPLKWEFPGGKVKNGETPQAALERELNEELGITSCIAAEIYRTRHKYAEMPEAVELIFFEARIEAGEIENRIFEQIAWVEPERLCKMDFLEADREFIEKLAKVKNAENAAVTYRLDGLRGKPYAKK